MYILEHYYLVSLYFLYTTFFIIILYIISLLLSSENSWIIQKVYTQWYNKNNIINILNFQQKSVYECGFEPFDSSRNAFEIHFYVIGILYMIFDLEMVYLFPWLLNLNYLNLDGFWAMYWFLILLLLGFIYELYSGILEW